MNGSLGVVPGSLHEVRFARIDPVGIDDVFELDYRTLDRYGNVASGDGADFVVRLSSTELGFVERAGLEIRAGGTLPTATASAGTGGIGVRSGEVTGEYTAAVTRTDGTPLATGYGAPGETVDALALSVLPGTAARFTLALLEVESDPLGDPERLEVGERATVRIALVDGDGLPVTFLELDGVERDANFDAAVRIVDVETDEVLDTASIGVVRGLGSVRYASDVPRKIRVEITDVTPAEALLRHEDVLELDIEALPAAIEDAGHLVVADDASSPLRFTFNADVRLPADAGDLGLVERPDESPVPGTYRLEGRDLLFEADEPYALGECFAYDTAGSGIAAIKTDRAVLDQRGEVCAPEVRLAVAEDTFVLEGDDLVLAGIELAPGVVRSAITSGRMVLHGYSRTFDWASGQGTLPTLHAPSVVDGEPERVAFGGRLAGEPLRVANELTYRVLLRAGDYDGDGLANELEIGLGLRADRTDSDGDGIVDGREDLDGDGLDNATEAALGSRADEADSDGDGLGDAEEVREHGTDPTLADTDGDGADDALELAVGSSPTDPDSRDVTDHVIALAVVPGSIDGYVLPDQAPTALAVTATVVAGDRTVELDVTDEAWGTTYAVDDASVLVHRGDGTLELIGAGSTEVTVTLGARSTAVPATVRAPTDLGDFVLESGTETLTGDFVASSVTVGDATLVLEGTLTVLGDVTLGDGAVLTVPDADTATKTIHRLDLEATGTVHVRAGAHVDLDAKGYPQRYRGSRLRASQLRSPIGATPVGSTRRGRASTATTVDRSTRAAAGTTMPSTRAGASAGSPRAS